MKFSLVCAVPNLDEMPSSGGLDDSLRTLEEAERWGFESFWMVDGSGRRDDSGSPLPVAAAHAAMHSQSISIGLMLPLVSRFHPLRLAEELAALDAMTDGRMRWSAVEEAGIPASDAPGSFCESFEIVSRALEGEPFAWEGQAYAFPEVACVPRPVQVPGPPAWVQVQSPGSVRWAASGGYGLMEDAWSPVGAMEERRALYRESSGSRDPVVDPGRFQTIRHVYVGESQARAREEVGPELLRAYPRRAVREAFGLPEASSGGRLDEAGGIDDSPESLLDFLFENTVVVGDEVYCREKVEALRERLGVDSLLCWQPWERLGAERRFASQKRWAERVVPAFA